MNERQPYEHLIADKLQQLPAPDVDTSWQQMRRMLNDSQSPKGGGGRKRFRPGGGGWWGAGIVAIVLVTATWVFIESRSSSQKELASAKHPAAAAAAAGNKDAPAKSDASGATTFNQHSTNNAPDQTSTLTSPTPASAGNTTHTPARDAGNNPAAQPAATQPGGALSGGIRNNNGNDNGAVATAPPAAARAGSLPVTADKDKPGSDNSKSLPDSKSLSKDKNSKDKNKTASNRSRRNIPLPPPPGSRETTTIAKNKLKTPGSTPGNRPNRANNNSLVNNGTPAAHRPGHHNRPLTNTDLAKNKDNHSTPGHTGNAADEQLLAKQRDRREHLEELMEPVAPGAVNSYLAAGDSVNPHKDTSHLLNDKTKAQIAKSRQAENEAAVAKAAAKKEKNPIRLNLHINPFSLKSDSDASWWGAGLALNAPLPVGGQSRYKYNVNGGTGLLTDYLPSPYVEFHLNQYVYLQTEINLSAPQYLSPVCLYQKMAMPFAGGGPSFPQRDQSIYIQKLYYFSWPVSLHYSPLNNFYLTTGLQFSSLQSGLALVNERRISALSGTPDSYSSKLVKFKDDSIAGQLKPNEWRWQLGAEYYWNRFTVGMRYNKSFSNLISVGPTNGVPDATVPNSALLFFVRFNFFEGRKKDNTQKDQRSLVRY